MKISQENNRILHITPTDIRYDSRILKELKAVEQIDSIDLKAFGINDDEGHTYKIDPLSYVKTFNLFTKKISFLPRPIKYFLNLLEAFFRLSVPAVRYKPTIIHCHDTLFLPIALITKLFCKSKLIYDAHELESDKGGQSKILSKYTLFIEKLSWKHIDLLISVSPSIINWYKDNFTNIDSLLILNAPEINAASKNKSNYLRDKFNIPSDKTIFLYLGILTVGRGIEPFLELFQREDIDAHLVFVGYGEYSEHIKQLATTNKNIHFHPAVQHGMVVEVANSADVGLCMIDPISLSDYYCLPNKLFEYAFSRLYILASDLPDIKQIVEGYSLGKCSSLDVDELYVTVKSINGQITKMKEVDLYPLSWEFQAKELINKYNNILTNKN